MAGLMFREWITGVLKTRFPQAWDIGQFGKVILIGTIVALALWWGFPAAAQAQPARKCSQPVTKKVEVAVRSPAPHEETSRKVLIHLRVTDPPECDATLAVTIDGTPYQFLGQAAGSPPFDSNNPERSRRLPKSKLRFACFSFLGDFFGSALLPRGSHTLRVRGACPQGTAVPQTVPVGVRFRVLPERAGPQVESPLPVTGLAEAFLLGASGILLLVTGFGLLRARGPRR